jgi:hypothetical protein
MARKVSRNRKGGNVIMTNEIQPVQPPAQQSQQVQPAPVMLPNIKINEKPKEEGILDGVTSMFSQGTSLLSGILGNQSGGKKSRKQRKSRKYHKKSMKHKKTVRKMKKSRKQKKSKK